MTKIRAIAARMTTVWTGDSNPPRAERGRAGRVLGVDQRGLRFRNLRAPSSNNHGAMCCMHMSMRCWINSSLNSGSPDSSRMRSGGRSQHALTIASDIRALIMSAPGLGHWLAVVGLVIVALPSPTGRDHHKGRWTPKVLYLGAMRSLADLGVAVELDRGETPGQVAQDVMNNKDVLTTSNLDAFHAGFFVGAQHRCVLPEVCRTDLTAYGRLRRAELTKCRRV